MRITDRNPSPIFDQVFQFTNLSESDMQMLVIAVYRHTYLVAWKMVGVIPVELKTADLSGGTVRRSIMQDQKTIKV